MYWVFAWNTVTRLYGTEQRIAILADFFPDCIYFRTGPEATEN